MENNKSAFFRRLRLYLIGVGMGCILVYFLLMRGKSFDFWMPGNRVMENIQKSELTYSINAECMMQCMNFSRQEIRKVIDSTGTVNFDESNTKASCPIYIIEDKERFDLKLTLSVCDSVANLLFVEKIGEKQSCDCN
jgi:hypothetical protein